MLRKIKCRGFWITVTTVMVCAAFSVPTAAAAQSYAFNPALSLTGDCSTSALDPLADPTCPGGIHPPRPFESPRGVAIDPSGDIYVASFGDDAAEGAQGRIDVFGPGGSFITEVADSSGPRSLAVDREGNLYVFDYQLAEVRRFEPSVYEPAAGKISYANPPKEVFHNGGSFVSGLAVNPENEHLFASFGFRFAEFKAASEDNELVGFLGEGVLNGQGGGLALDSAHGRIYVSDMAQPGNHPVVRIFELGGSHSLLQTIEGCDTGEQFAFEPSVAANEETGEILAYAGNEIPPSVCRFTLAGSFIGRVEHSFKWVFRANIAIDNGPSSPHRGYLFVPSHPSGTAHSFAFGPTEECEPKIKGASFANVAATEAELRATINPCNAATSYIFEYTTQKQFDEVGFAGGEVAGQGQLPAVANDLSVGASAVGLTPETSYRFRLTATNGLGSQAAEGSFATYPPEPTFVGCPNDATRIGPSVGLPDCRAYELVTPPDTNARSPLGIALAGEGKFATREAAPDGNRVSFRTEGGTIGGFEGTGSLQGDQYLASRGSGGWTTASAGPTGAEATAPVLGSTSNDQGFFFWEATGQGSAVIGGQRTAYVRYPDGHSDLVGRGSIGSDPGAKGVQISPGGTHLIFVSTEESGHSAVQLEPSAPPDGTQAIYDRTSDEITHVISLLPGNQTPKPGEDASYDGASLNGIDVVFSLANTLYLRRDNTVTYEVAKEATFAGVAEGGGRVFYLKAGKFFAFDADTQETVPFASSGDVTPVNISADGSSAYFVSAKVLTSKANPNGAKPSLGGENLYLSREGAISFVGTVTTRDVEGEMGASEQADGLGLWLNAVQFRKFGKDPSRSTPDGRVLLFESRAALEGTGGYDPEGHAEIYRFDVAGPTLECISCNPTGAPAAGSASLQSVLQSLGAPEPLSSYGLVDNLRGDGRRAFFQSTEQLVAADTDELQDVYEWEAQGVGTCVRSGGCVYLVSSGQSARADYLYAVSEEGDDIFFSSSDLLVEADHDTTPSIYDARINGGFPEQALPEPCQGEGCRTGLFSAPPTLAPESGVTSERKPTKTCPKGKRKVRHGGRTRCVRKHRPHRHAHGKKRSAK